MKRIMIIGCGGAGKSTLAHQLGEKLDIPVVHLDQIWWKPGWEHIAREDFDSKVLAETQKAQWIMDGNYNRTIRDRLKSCDTIIYLDFSRWSCLFGWLKRVIINWGRSRADMAEGCTEWFDPEMAKWIWNFNRNHREEYYRLLNEAEGVETIVLKNRRMVKRFLESV